MDVRVGTSGYAYKEWKGTFYPDDLPQKKFLEYYASRLRTVEINNTFYRVPKRDVVRSWADAVPDDFSFVLKASMRVTHKARLKDAEEPLGWVVRSAKELGDKQGPMLFQLPPYLRRDVGRLKGFLELLPEGWKSGFEFRHESWFHDETYDALTAHNVALVVSETEKHEPPVEATASYGYLRLRRAQYTPQQLDAWAQTISDQPWKTAHVFFKHEDEAAGPLVAEKFAQRFSG